MNGPMHGPTVECVDKWTNARTDDMEANGPDGRPKFPAVHVPHQPLIELVVLFANLPLTATVRSLASEVVPVFVPQPEARRQGRLFTPPKS